MNLSTSDLTYLAVSQIAQVTLVALAVGLTARLLCRHRPHLAHALWLLVLLKCLTPPLIVNPTGQFSWAQWSVEAPCLLSALDSVRPYSLLEDLGTAPGSAEPVTPVEAVAAAPSVSLAFVLLSLWLSGNCVLGSVVLCKWLRVAGPVRRARPAPDEVIALAVKLTSSLGMRRPARVVVTDCPLSPAIYGLFRPSVNLPNCSCGTI